MAIQIGDLRKFASMFSTASIFLTTNLRNKMLHNFSLKTNKLSYLANLASLTDIN
jgi:hypothetical protein